MLVELVAVVKARLAEEVCSLRFQAKKLRQDSQRTPDWLQEHRTDSTGIADAVSVEVDIGIRVAEAVVGE